MNTRFLVIGDNHLDSKTPQNRLDNYMEATLMELEECLLIAQAAKVDFCVFLGDIFNRMEVGGECRNRALRILSSNKGELWSFKKYVVIGNHDIAHNPNNLEKSALYTLISAGVIECVDFLPDLSIRFWHFTPDLDQKLREGVLLDYDEKIMFLHASIVTVPAKFDHVLFDDLQVGENTKLLFSGHIHKKMQAEKNGIKFLNPGPVGRHEISSEYEKNKVSVMLCQYDYITNELKTREMYLKYSLPYDVVFDVNKNLQKKTENKNTELFIKAITDIEMVSPISSDLKDDLIDYAKKANTIESVVKEAIDAIDLVKTGGVL
jgi:DNA repair exonuclease SbcCD nuclease subunit